MHVAALAYSLGGVSLAVTLVATVLHGLCLASSRSVSSNAFSIELVIVSLSATSCVMLVALVMLWGRKTRTQPSERWPACRTAAYGLILAYLLIANGIIAGAVAWRTYGWATTAADARVPQRHLVLYISRCVVWGISVFGQGLIAGFPLMSLAEDCGNRCPSSLSKELELHSDQSSLKDNKGAIIVESQRSSLDPKTSCDDSLLPVRPAASIVSTRRYSGRTLFQQDSMRGSLDLYPSRTRTSSLEYSSPRCSISTENRQAPQWIQRTPSEIQRSLDSLLLQPSSGRSSPASIQLETPRIPPPAPKLNIPDESNIHPLFRSDSPSPPPTPMPGTNVHASPVAGQTISVRALNRVRSTKSLRGCGPRSRPPLFERMGQEAGLEIKDGRTRVESAIPGFTIARYKRYELNESPDES